MARDGDYCPLCGTEVYDWQAEEYEVLGNLCPECSLEAEDYFAGEDWEDIEEMVSQL